MDDEYRTRALLLGGPFDFRTVRVKPEDYQVLVVLPQDRDRMLNIDPYEPTALDLRVARYVAATKLADRMGRLVGMVYEYDGTQ